MASAAPPRKKKKARQFRDKVRIGVNPSGGPDPEDWFKATLINIHDGEILLYYCIPDGVCPTEKKFNRSLLMKLDDANDMKKTQFKRISRKKDRWLDARITEAKAAAGGKPASITLEVTLPNGKVCHSVEKLKTAETVEAVETADTAETDKNGQLCPIDEDKEDEEEGDEFGANAMFDNQLIDDYAFHNIIYHNDGSFYANGDLERVPPPYVVAGVGYDPMKYDNLVLGSVATAALLLIACALSCLAFFIIGAAAYLAGKHWTRTEEKQQRGFPGVDV